MRLCEITLGDWVNLEKLGPVQVDGKTYINFLQTLRIPWRGATENDFLLGLVPIPLITDISLDKENLEKFGFKNGTLVIRDIKVEYTDDKNLWITNLNLGVCSSYSDVKSIRGIQNKLREEGFFDEATQLSISNNQI